MQRLTPRASALLVGVMAIAALASGRQSARADTPADCDPAVSQCSVRASVPPIPGGGGPPTSMPPTSGPPTRGQPPRRVDCVDRSLLTGPTNGVVPCVSAVGMWSNAQQCYLQPLTPPPAPGDPRWQGHTTGAVYSCTTSLAPSTRFVWLAAPPAGLAPVVTPAQLAQTALATLTIPTPVVQRSPSQDNSDNGVPYTWVNVWTWWWTTPQSWKPLTARATAGAQWATVVVSPSTLRITPGDGSPDVLCTGPGRPWVLADGNDPPTGGGCAHLYRHVTANGALTATMAIDWTVAWQGAGGTSGVLPPMRTVSPSEFAVQQIQVVNR